ncbi:hypothetical protein [Thalassospira alkalitolerans]|uniref:hypothetical protein n=1 Tax=Thalassospira alkalitolerans TaxID=1293890 RepID=UPI0030EB86A0|tara:strand:- start:234 stop:2813 length:2580 start_codon:yes stop_codon:yes gene_type:complete
MAIDKSLESLFSQDDFDMGPEGLVVVQEEEGLGDSIVTELEGGGVEIDFDPLADIGSMETEFSSNLAEVVDDEELRTIAVDLIGKFNADKSSRGDWEQTYREGLDNLGLEIEDRTTPWAGACGVFHPMLSEAVVRFQSQTIQEIMPAKGPVKTQVWGLSTKEREDQAKRVQDYMNFQLLEVMTEYRPETEKLLFSLPLAGSAFRKIYFDPSLNRPTSMFVPAEDFVVSYNESDLDQAERYTHVMNRSTNQIRKLQVSGFYKDVELSASYIEDNPITDKYQEIGGVKPSYDKDERHQLLEMHVDLDLPGFEDGDGVALPYVITIEKGSSTILSIYRNWSEDDENREKKQHFVHYGYVPGIGFYNLGLIHMIGGLAKSATSLLRQLVDAGTLSNLPGGLKTRGLRIKGDDTPIMPGEFRDVDVPGGVIRDNITFLPYKEPSSVLYQLLGNIVEEGRRFASMADLKVADMNQEAPVGTTLAIMERAMKVQSAIQARIHASLKQEYKILARIIYEFTDPDYPYETGAAEGIKLEDFDDRVDIIPVSDPNASSMAQRIMQYQAALQLAAQAPNLYDLPLLHRQMMELIGIPNADKVVPTTDEVPPKDPVSENQDILTQSPVKVYEYQDHEAHMRVHMVLKNDPQMAQEVQNSPAGGAVMGALDSHVREHLAFIFRKQVEDELGVPLPPMGQPLPEDVEKRLSTLVADAADQAMGKKQQQAQAAQQAAQQEDPILQMRQQELAIRQSEVEAKQQAEVAKQQLAQEKLQVDSQFDQQKLQVESQLEQQKLEAGAQKSSMDQQMDAAELHLEVQKLASKERMETEGLKLEEQKLALASEMEEAKFEAAQELEGVKIGREIAKDDDSE